MPVHNNPENIKEKIAQKAAQAAKIVAANGSDEAMEMGKKKVEQELGNMDIDVERDINLLAGPPSETDSERSTETVGEL